MIDDIREGRNSPKYYPIVQNNNQEKTGCDILFAYDFDRVGNLTPVDDLVLEIPLDLVREIPLNLIDEAENSGKIDGITKFTEFIPFSKTNLDDFLAI